MKVKDFLACIEALDQEGVEDPYELEMVLHPSVNIGADLIWYSHNEVAINFKTKTTLLQEGYSEEVISAMGRDWVHHDIS